MAVIVVVAVIVAVGKKHSSSSSSSRRRRRHSVVVVVAVVVVVVAAVVIVASCPAAMELLIVEAVVRTTMGRGSIFNELRELFKNATRLQTNVFHSECCIQASGNCGLRTKEDFTAKGIGLARLGYTNSPIFHLHA